MLEFDKFDTALDLDDSGQPIAYDLQFQSGVTAVNTYHMHNTEHPEVHLYIDVDEEDIPIAISLVHPPSKVTYKRVGRDDPGVRKIVFKAYQDAYLTVQKAKAIRATRRWDLDQMYTMAQSARDVTRTMRDLEKLQLVTA